MKKLSLLAITLISASVASCKKDYVCECVTVGTSTSGSTTVNNNAVVVTKRDISKTNKKTAEAICGNYTQTSSSSYMVQGTMYSFSDVETSTCGLK